MPVKLQKNTIALVFLALGLGVCVWITEERASETAADSSSEVSTTTAARESLFTATAEDLVALEIVRPGQEEPLRLVKNRSTETEAATTAWQMEAPQEGVVTSAAIAFLTDVLLVEADLRSFEVAPELLGEYGLEEPLATLVLTWNDGSEGQLAVGNPSFDGQSLYARLNPSPDAGASETVEILLVDPDLQYAVERPIEEWLAPGEFGAETNAE